MNTLTNEEKAKVFAMYILQDVLLDEKIKAKIVGFEYSRYPRPVVLNWDLPTGKNVVNEWDLIKILLTPLSEISDEDAIVISKFCFTDSVPQKELKEIGKNYVFYFFCNGRVSEKSSVTLAQFDVPDNYQIYQYLIQQGYAVPLFFGIGHWANGMNAIELGIAIKK